MIQIPDTEYDIDFWRDVDHEGMAGRCRRVRAKATPKRTHWAQKSRSRTHHFVDLGVFTLTSGETILTWIPARMVAVD